MDEDGGKEADENQRGLSQGTSNRRDSLSSGWERNMVPSC